MAQDLLDTLDAQQIEKATFIGHSMGGKAVMALTALAPDRIDRLVAIDIAPVDYHVRRPRFAFSRPLTPSANPTRHPANRRQGLCASTSTKKA
ncbi:esterase/lipase YbfF [Salmonella enterica subsp. enterica serovar Typhimurium]|nr:esterase/lipase YbfF [Salmonella enterica subsp. enterica serovar Typhimurium]